MKGARKVSSLDSVLEQEQSSSTANSTGTISRLADNIRSVPGKVLSAGLSLFAAGWFYFGLPNKAEAQSVEQASYHLVNENNQIRNIKDFLDSCPKNDPAYEQIKKDFKIRRNGVLVDLDSVKCTEPTSAMPEADWSDELAQLQALRVEYYMDFGMSGHLPWTDGTGYDWLRSEVQGINISDLGGPGCCDIFDNKIYFTMNARKEKAKWLGTSWKNLSGDVGAHWHEGRHVPGTNFPHVSCNGHDNMDQTFDINNLSTYGVQWWLNYLWLKGVINVGVSCLDSAEKADIINRYFDRLVAWRGVFCDENTPHVVMPSNPGGSCVGASVSGTLKDSFGNTLDDIVVEAVNSDGIDLLGNKSFVAAGVVTDTNGGFKVVRLLGDYKLFTEPDECFVPQWFSGKQSEQTADVLTLFEAQNSDVSLTLQDRVFAGPQVSGANAPKAGVSSTYTATRKSDFTNPIEFYFDWGDGTNSGWLPVGQNTANKSWNKVGAYNVTAKYKCAEHGVESELSNALQVTAKNPDGPDLTAQWIALPYETHTNPKKGLPKYTLKGGVLQISNAGNQKSGTAKVAFYLSSDNTFDAGDLYLKQSNVAALKPTRTKNVSLTQKLAAGATAKDQYIIAVINVPTDIDTTNNIIVYGPIQ